MTTTKTPDTTAVAQRYAARVDELVGEKVEPRAIDPLVLGHAADPVVAAVAQHLKLFAEFQIDASTLEFLRTTGKQLITQVSALPSDLRKALRVPQSAKDLAGDAHGLLGRWGGYLERKARGKLRRKAARKLGYGQKRGRSIKALEANYRTILAAAQEAEACALLEVTAGQIAALKSMHDQLIAALPLVVAQGRTRAKDIQAINRARLTLELVYQDIAAAADWALDGPGRVALLSLLPRSEVGRSKPEVKMPAQAA